MSSNELNITVPLDLSPQQIAEQFWDLGSDGQTAFYAHLHQIAGHRLGIQCSAIEREIVETDNRDAREAWTTLHGFASEYTASAIEIRADNAKYDIARTVAGARA